MAYATKAQVQTLLGAFTIPAEWTDELITASLARAKRTVDGFVGNTFEPVTRTVLMDGDGTALLAVYKHAAYPINTVASVKIRENAGDDFASVTALTADTDYVVHRSRRALERVSTASYLRGGGHVVSAFDEALHPYTNFASGAIWPRGTRNVQVVGTFGTNGVPDQVVKAVVMLVREEILPGHVASIGDDYVSRSFGDGFSETRARPTAGRATVGNTTGYPTIDNLLIPFRVRRVGVQ
jgi:hypothetical protein